jgi:hypothetical protein
MGGHPTPLGAFARHVPLRLKSVKFKRNRKREQAYAIA